MTDLLAEREDPEAPNLFAVRSHAIMLDRKPNLDADLMDKIRAHVGGPVEPKDVFPFRMVAASDGVDSYWTQHDLETSLKGMATDLQRGQSLLGNHDYGTFSYGSSVDGKVQRADTNSPIYEETFFRGLKLDPSLATQNWLVGDYYVVRGITLNGEQTDSIIRGIELGALRKASISFTVDEFLCGIDGKDMLAARMWGSADGSRFAKRHEADDSECMHLPGVAYEEGRAWARMHGSQLLETSLVYKNASPSSLLLRKAEDMARAGLLTTKQQAEAEVQYGVRLPRFERTVFAGVGKEVDDVTKRQSQETEGTPAADASAEVAPPVADPPEPTEEEEVEEETEGTEEASEEPTADRIVSEFVAASTAVRSALTADLLGSEEMESIAASAMALDRDLAPRSTSAVSVVIGRQTDAARQTRDHEVEEVLGRPISVEAIRSLKADATLGQTLFETLVNDAIAARNGLGAEYDVESYKGLLRSSRSVEFVKAEKASYEALKADRFKAGRQVVPAAVREEKARKQAPTAPKGDDNVFVPRAQK